MRPPFSPCPPPDKAQSLMQRVPTLEERHHGKAASRRIDRRRSGSFGEILRTGLRYEARRHGPSRPLHVRWHHKCLAAKEGERQGKGRYLSLRYVVGRPRCRRKESGGSRWRIPCRTTDLAKFVL